MSMRVNGAGEALFIATEMEKRAVRLYERALLLHPDAELARDLLKDEKSHLRVFTRMAEGFGLPAETEKALLLNAYASGVLFPGGLMEAQRREAFESRASLAAFAAEQEAKAVSCYRDFAHRCQGEAREAFLSIAEEESRHLEGLNALVERIGAGEKKA